MTILSRVSWNIHRGRGQDGRVDPARTVKVLREEVVAQGTDILLLQEADEERPPHVGILDLAEVADSTGPYHLHGDDRRRWGARRHGFLGVVFFAAPGIEVEDMVLLDLPGHCHRGAVIVDLRKDDTPLRMIGTHLSLSQMLRVAQMRTLAQHLFRRAARSTILCGDLNEWRPWGALSTAV